ncbi:MULTISPECIES: hypothetical protein [Leucobacter]|uniref:hypothetical protein n=1 Tax=Leucobacter TaxID=55968 RepID=UPI0006227C1B|nr:MULTISPECIES: hypothetical protein [Leucobacter]KKI22725.1 hypothetical protein XM48_00405 [Leucobacter sp. Ag1]
MKNKAKFGLGALASAALIVAGLVVTPGAYAVGETDTESDTIGGEVKDVIIIQTTGDVNIKALPDAGGRISSKSHDVIVSTTSTGGYTLQARSISPSSLMANVNDPSTGFAAVSGTPLAPVALGNDQWGFRLGAMPDLNNVSSTPYNFAGMTNANQTIKTAGAAVMGDVTKVNYAIKAKDLAVGLYTNEVLYTATAQ